MAQNNEKIVNYRGIFIFGLYNADSLDCSLYLNGMDDISEWQFRGESEAMVDDGFSGIEVSHIQSCRKKYQRLRYRACTAA